MRNYSSGRRRDSFFDLYNRSAVFWIIVSSVVLSILLFILISFYCTETQCVPLDYLALKPESILSGNYLWTLVTHIFVHGGIFHLFINMFVLFSLGRLCETIIGRKRFVFFYLLAGIFAGVLSVLASGFFGNSFESIFGGANTYMVGASGAIFGIAGLFVMLLPRLRFSIIFLPFFSLPAYIMVPLVLIITWIASVAGGLGIGNVAHLGGFLAGIFYGYYLRKKYQKKVAMLQRYFR